MFGAMIYISVIVMVVVWSVIFFSAKYLTTKGRWGFVVSIFIVSIATLFSIYFSLSIMSFLSPMPFEPRTLFTLFLAAIFQVIVSTTMLISFHKRAAEGERLQKEHSYTYPEKPSEINVTKKQNPLLSIEIIAAIIQAAATLIAAWITLSVR